MMVRAEDFEGVPFTSSSSIGYLSGQFGREFLEEYTSAIKEIHPSTHWLDVLSFDEEKDRVVGSNAFAVVVANQILRKEGLRTASIQDFIHSFNSELDRTYPSDSPDLALYLQYKIEAEDSGNHYHNSISEQITPGLNIGWYVSDFVAKLLTRLHTRPHMVIPYNELEIRRDENSLFDGLSFYLSKESALLTNGSLAQLDMDTLRRDFPDLNALWDKENEKPTGFGDSTTIGSVSFDGAFWMKSPVQYPGAIFVVKD
jgi:hypothetical protein